MQTHLEKAPHLHSTLIIAVVVGMTALSIVVLAQPQRSASDGRLALGSQAVVASLASGSESLLQQTVAHLSKMQRGHSIGGFPGFEPPENDEKYRRKISNQEYTAQDVNGWVKESNNFLQQLADKNPGLTLEEILHRQGLTQIQIDEFVEALRETQFVARAQVGQGVRSETVETLKTILERLGVALWQY